MLEKYSVAFGVKYKHYIMFREFASVNVDTFRVNVSRKLFLR